MTATAVLALGGTWCPAAAARASDTALSEADDSAGLLAEMNLVPVQGVEVDRAMAAVRANLSATATEADRQQNAEAHLAELADGLAALLAHRRDLEAARDAAIAAKEAAHGRADAHDTAAHTAQRLLDEVAIETYIGGNGANDDVLASTAFTTAGRKARYALDVFAQTLATKRHELAERDQARHEEAVAAAEEAHQTDELGHNAADIAANGTDRAQTEATRDEAVAEQRRLADELVARRVELAAVRRLGKVIGADFPLVVLDAFRRAEELEHRARPGCGLRWQLLAAISKIESNHGTYGGGAVAANGDTSVIVGPRLDGTSGFASIPDSDGGRLDGDPTYDRAVGPMQFIPSSWRIFGMDGNGDGVANPRNYYDATLAAGEHLCRSGADLGTSAGLRSAILGYNNSDAYVAVVLSALNRYLPVTW